MEIKDYYCCICHKKIKKNIRLVMQKWGKAKFGFGNIANYDFCDRCILTFKKWIEKHEVENDKRD